MLVSAMGRSLIVNRYDYDPVELGHGVGIEILERGDHEIDLAVLGGFLAGERRQSHGQGVMIVDGGANIGHLSVFWARFMDGATTAPWGLVVAIEPQEWPFYALCGNIALNNCFNVAAHRMVIGDSAGFVNVPFHHPLVPFNFGSCALSEKGKQSHLIQQVAIDDMSFKRLDILKLDIEGTEPDAIAGSVKTIEKFRPLIIAEVSICGVDALEKSLDGLGYDIMPQSTDNVLCVHKTENNQTLRTMASGIHGQAGARSAALSGQEHCDPVDS